MHLKLTIKRPHGRETNVGVTVDATALVGDLANALYAGDPARAGGDPPADITLRIDDRTSGESGKILDPSRNLIEVGLRSGSVVSLARHTNRRGVQGVNQGPTAALIRVLDGPDKDKQFPLPQGTSTIGRLPDNDVQLRDPQLSKRHARVIVGETVEIVDTNSANGLVIGGRQVARAMLGSADVVVLGSTAITIARTQLAGTVEPTSPVFEFNRSPRVVPRIRDRTVDAPEPPKQPAAQRFPILSLFAPLLMGVALFAFTRSVLSIVFIALSPLLMIAMYVDEKLAARRASKKAKAAFEANLAALTAEMTTAQTHERAMRHSRTPAVRNVLSDIHQLGPLLWSYRPEHDTFLSVRLGVGTAPSHCTIITSDDATALPEYRARLAHFKATFDVIADVPMIGDLRTAGVLGIAGRRGVVEGVARSIVLQLVGLHSPAEVVLTVLASPMSRSTWEWVEWLPHTGSVHSPLHGTHLADNQGTGLSVLAQLEGIVAGRLAHGNAKAEERGPIDGFAGATTTPTHEPPTLPAIVVLVEDDTPVDRARLTRLAETGADVSVHVIWVASQVNSLPSVCRTYLLAEPGEAGCSVGQVRHGIAMRPVTAEPVDAATATAAALFMSPVVDAGIAVEDATDLPSAISWLDLAGTDVASDPEAVTERWREGGSLWRRDDSGTVLDVPKPRANAGLRSLVGSAGATPLVLDLREHGPHALVGGTTGSGKSEFLQTWVLGMAVANSPDRVTFLFVDYKGGAAFADCIGLPHAVGLVTDLSQHLVRRALTSLRAEIRYREHLLNRKKAKDLVSLERLGDPECPPSLVIIVDEFAALVQEVPEFVDGVVDVAQRGRSLGLHLILATQRPAGVIKDNLRANTNLRVALRMADAEDATDVVGVPDAASFPTTIPGRALAKTGPGPLTTFQTGYVGGWTTETPDAPPIEIAEMRFGAPAEWEVPQAVRGSAADRGPTDMARVVETINAAATAAHIPEPRKPWLPELQSTYDTKRLAGSANDTELLLGVGDNPAEQSQPTMFYRPDRDGNMVIFGASGAGKSATLRQLAIASAVTFPTGPVFCYGLDFGSAGLRLIEPLPGVGAIIDGDDEERLARLMRRLVAIVDERAVRYADARASTITEYRRNSGKVDEPRIIVLVDGLAAFREAYEHSVASPWFTMFSQIAADGRGVGVHVVVTADRPNALPASLGSTIQRRIVLRLAGEDDYLMLGVPRDVLSPASPPGRGILDGNEIQVAVHGGDPNVAVQAREIARFAARMERNGAPAAPSVDRLPDDFTLATLPPVAGTSATGNPLPTIGIADTTLEPVGFDAAGILALSGPPGSGRTTAMVTLAQAVERAIPGRKRVLLSARLSPLAAAQRWTGKAVGADDVATLARQIVETIRDGRIGPGGLAIFVESITGFNSSSAESDLLELIKIATDEGHLVVGEAEISSWSQAWSLSQPFKSGRRGLLVVPGDMDGDSLLNTPLGRIRAKDFPPGRGFLVDGGKAVKLHVAQPDS